MIGSIRGSLIDRNARGVLIVESGGVGYELNVTLSSAAVIGALGDEVFLHVHTRVREDAITLYGFPTAEEKRCFEALIGAHGVGPSMALALLAMYSPTTLRQIVATDDSTSLAAVPGIGKKTATRLLMELKAKFDVDLDSELVDISVSAASESGDSVRGDVVAALSGLGYEGDEIRKVLSGLPPESDVGTLLRMALRELAVSA
jgi:holliday junction DNA helicase RuvA